MSFNPPNNSTKYGSVYFPNREPEAQRGYVIDQDFN